MSAIPVLSPTPRPRPVAAAPRVVRKVQVSPWPAAAVVFVGCLALSYGASTLLGNSVMESARREAGRAESRARVARDETARLQRRLDRLTSPQSVASWARLRGFVPVHTVFSRGVDERAAH